MLFNLASLYQELGDLDINHKLGVDGDMIAGYDFGMFRAEAELGYKRSHHDEYEFGQGTIDADIPRQAAERYRLSDVNAGERPELPGGVPTIPASAGALVRGRKGRLLVLKPTYKGGWTIPGGVIEIGESPWEACRREAKEESGLDITGHGERGYHMGV